MVIPAREVPDERQCLGEADDHGVGEVQVVHAPERHADTVGKPQQDAEAEGRPADDLDGADAVREVVVHGEAGGDHGDGGDDDQARHLGTPVAPAADGARDARQHLPDLAVEIEAHGPQRADVHGDVDDQSLVGPAEEMGGQHQMRRGGNRKKFRDALNERQDRKM